MNKIKPFNVLLTCCSLHATTFFKSLKDNPDGVAIGVYATNCSEADLPPADSCDGRFVVPRIDAPGYIDAILNLCKEYSIDILIPTSTLELEFVARERERFEKEGVKVSVCSLQSLTVANNKKALYSKFKALMPAQCDSTDYSSVYEFVENHKTCCCKLTDQCGGKGFAIVDNHKADDVSLFHRYGQKHFISKTQLLRIVDKGVFDLLIQEYVPGKDYTVSLLADNGTVTHMVGYVGYEMEFGAIMKGEILDNEEAFKISERIVNELNLDGNIGVDFILKDDGSVVLLEVNPRVNGSLSFAAAAGCNMLYYRCVQLLGYPINHYQPEIIKGLKMKKYFETQYFI